MAASSSSFRSLLETCHSTWSQHIVDVLEHMLMNIQNDQCGFKYI